MNGQQPEQLEAPFGNATCEQGHCESFPAHHSTSGQRTHPPHRWESPAQGQEWLCLPCGRDFPLKSSKHCSRMLVPRYKVRWKSSVQKGRQESPAVQNGMNWGDWSHIQPCEFPRGNLKAVAAPPLEPGRCSRGQ